MHMCPSACLVSTACAEGRHRDSHVLAIASVYCERSLFVVTLTLTVASVTNCMFPERLNWIRAWCLDASLQKPFALSGPEHLDAIRFEC